MATSGTTSFLPKFSDLMEEAFERAGIAPAAITADHIRSAMRSIELMLGVWSVHGVNQWKVESYTQDLTASSATYNLPSGAFDVQSVAFRQQIGSNETDIILQRVTRNDFLAIPDKALLSDTCSLYWIDRDRDTPTITVWPVPQTSDHQLVYYYLKRIEDAGKMINTPDLPFYWFDALAAGWAARIAQKYNYDRFADLTVMAENSLKLAKEQDVEMTDICISYQCGGQ